MSLCPEVQTHIVVGDWICSESFLVGDVMLDRTSRRKITATSQTAGLYYLCRSRNVSCEEQVIGPPGTRRQSRRPLCYVDLCTIQRNRHR